MRTRLIIAMLSLVAIVASLGAPTLADTPVTRATLSNGLKVIIVRDPLAPVATEELNILAGSDVVPAGFPGMAHAQEHMMFRSAKGLSAAQQADIAAALGGAYNADTQQSVTQYFFTVPAEYLDIALRLEAARLVGALDSQDEWAQERGAIEQEVSQDLSNSFYRYYSTALRAMFSGSPYEHDALGTRPSFDKTTGAMLKRFHDQWYVPNNAVLVISGNVDPQATLALVKSIFGAIPSKPLPRRPAYAFKPVKPQTLKLDSDLPIPIVLLTYRLPGFDSKDYAAMVIADDVLSSQRGKLFALQAEGKALAAGFQYQALPHAGLGFAYIGTAPGSDTNAASTLLRSTISEYIKEGAPADLVDASKRHEVAQAQYNSNSIEGLANQWSQAVAVEGRQSPDDDVALFAAVTKADVDRVLKKYLDTTSTVVGVLTPKPAGAPSRSPGFGGKETFAPKDQKPTELPDWAKRLLGDVTVPKSNLSPTDTTLPNGIRLIVQPESISPTVTVVGAVRTNPLLQTPAGKDGVADVLGGLFSYGTTSLDRVAFQKALDDIAADESAGARFSLSVQSVNFDRGMQLLADNELHPALPAAAFAIVQAQTAQGLQGEQQSPDYLAERSLLGALFPPTDPALRQPTPDTIKSLTLDDAKAYYASAFRPDMTTLIVIGDVTPDAAKAAVQKWFGAWSATGPKPVTDLPPVPTNSPSAAMVPATGRTQDTVTLAETVDIKRSDPDYYALQLGNAVLGGGFYSTRFYKELRLKAGLVYYVSAGLQADKTRARYNVSFGSDPGNVAKARAIVDRLLKDMAATTVGADELRLAKTTIVRDLSLAESTESGIAGGLLRRSLADLPLDEPVRQATAIVAMTADTVRSAFAKHVDPARFVEIIEGPAPK